METGKDASSEDVEKETDSYAIFEGATKVEGNLLENVTTPGSTTLETKISAFPTFFATSTKDIAEVESSIAEAVVSSMDTTDGTTSPKVPIFFATTVKLESEPQRPALSGSGEASSAVTDLATDYALAESETNVSMSPTGSVSMPHFGAMEVPDTVDNVSTDVVDMDAIVSKIPQRPEENPSMQSLDKAEQLRSRKTIPSSFALDSIPTISSWVENLDDSITGIVNNSPSFESGEEIVTAPIVERAERVLNFGRKVTIVTTVSGSKYRLVGPSRSTNGRDSRFKDSSPLEIPPGFGFDPASEDMKGQPPSPSPLTSIDFGKFLDGWKMLPVGSENENKDQKNSPISPLAFLGQGTGKAFKDKEPPRGVEGEPSGTSSLFSSKIFGISSGTTIPTLSSWEQNSDGSITGYVANRIGFKDGTLITTSPVKTRARAGRVVTTTGGSRYKLM